MAPATTKACFRVQVDMYRVVRTWENMPVDLFEDVMRALVYAGRVGAESTLGRYIADVREFARAYHTCARTVRTSAASCHG